VIWAPFLCGVFFVAYTLLGYPLLLLIWGLLRPKPIRRAPLRLTVSVLIPVRNGERYLRDKLQSVFTLRYPAGLLQVIVISDGSTDRSVAIAREFPQVEVIELPAGGKCLALNAGMARATGEILFFTDVRQLLDPDCLSRLVACFADPSVGVASGEVVIVNDEDQELASVGLYLRMEEWLRKQISAVGSVAGATGAIYAMRRKLAAALPADVLVDDMYQPIQAYFQGYRVILEDGAIAYDYPNSLAREFRRKVRTLAGIYQIIWFFPRLFHPRYGISFHFLSHKVARLLLPYAFLLIATGSFLLPFPWNVMMLSGQGFFYGLALADRILPQGFFLKKLSVTCRHFVILMAASASAISIVFRPSRSLWGEQR
jgi:cellulose synthase/poly-beta-1,6-N-acetylglucosamine synthase-like glycosyltransferase